jgi:hypothetical protein
LKPSTIRRPVQKLYPVEVSGFVKGEEVVAEEDSRSERTTEKDDILSGSRTDLLSNFRTFLYLHVNIELLLIEQVDQRGMYGICVIYMRDSRASPEQ